MQEKVKDIPLKVGGCIDLSPEKARMLYTLLYELIESRKGKMKEETGYENGL